MKNRQENKLIIANWKMNGLRGFSAKLAADIASFVGDYKSDIVICPPFTSISEATLSAQNSNLKIGAQDCHEQESGAYTGNVPAVMLRDAGCEYVIVGHSERRQYHKESNELVRQKAHAAIEAGLVAVICVGESLTQREQGVMNDVVGEQIRKSVPDNARADNMVIAYEPVWAIGTGKIPTSQQIGAMHDFINDLVAKEFPDITTPADALYGGSVKAENADEILAIGSVGGLLVGGASLKVDSFEDIIKAAENV